VGEFNRSLRWRSRRAPRKIKTLFQLNFLALLASWRLKNLITARFAQDAKSAKKRLEMRPRINIRFAQIFCCENLISDFRIAWRLKICLVEQFTTSPAAAPNPPTFSSHAQYHRVAPVPQTVSPPILLR
jgi:hypothetical protein